PQGKSDVVEATIEINNGDIDPEKVIFKTPGGTEFKSEYQIGVYTINLIGGEAGDGQEIYAVYPSPLGGAGGGFLNFGKLGVVSYREQAYKAIIVPVNDTETDLSAIRQTLKEIYGPVGIAWEVSEEKGYSYFGENKFFEKNSGLLSSYTEEMRKMNADFAGNYKNGNIDATANYVFVLKYSGSTMERDAAGFMPRGGQFGYIFTKDFQSDKEILNTIAHELGHGRLLLKHTFDKDYGITQGVTDNLMDYSGKTHLAKWQWDLLSDPGIAQGVFDRDQDGMKAGEFAIESKNIPAKDGIYLTPAGKPIWLSELANIEIIRPVAENEDVLSTVVNVDYLKEAVYGFVRNENGKEERYFSHIKGNKFVGYYKTSNTGNYIYYTEPNEQGKPDNMASYFKEGGNVQTRTYSLHRINNGNITTEEVSKWWYYQDDWTNYKGDGELVKNIDCGCKTIAKEYENSPLKQHGLGAVIDKDPCVLNTLYGFNNGVMVMRSEWMKDFEKAFGFLTNIIVAPAVAEIVVAPMLESLISLVIEQGSTLAKYLVKDEAKDALVGTFMDICLQASIFMIFEDLSAAEALKKVDFVQALATGVESAANNFGLSAFVVPIYGVLVEDGKFNTDRPLDEMFSDYAIQSSITIIVQGLVENKTNFSILARNAFNRLKIIYKSNPQKFRGRLLEILESLRDKFGVSHYNAPERADDLVRYLDDAATGSLQKIKNYTDNLRSRQFNRLAEAIEKIPDEITQVRFIDELNSVSSGRVDDLLRKMNQNIDMVDAWKYIGRSEMRLDPDILESTARMIKSHPDFTATHSEMINHIYQSLGEARAVCKTCPGSLGQTPDLQVGNMEDIIDNLNDAISKYADLPGFAVPATGSTETFLKEMAESGKKAKGGSFTLDLLKNRFNELSENGRYTLIRFEGTIPDIETGHKLDLYFETLMGESKSVEIKNWSTARMVGEEQFLAYIKSGKQFEYYFNGTTTEMKTVFQNHFRNKVYEWLNPLNPEINNFKKIFDVNNLAEFELLAENLNSKMYNFIK
ncbi:MAG: hypothetical protein LBQ60_11895, partial [Bacteroidales bacterium]|nr:hypothetical protein [Bacteroidales bacterium]